ncbi:MAG: methyltransferase domain-containing protein [Planctomycetota bacterium]
MPLSPAQPVDLPPSVANRRLVPEVMDDPTLAPALHEAALRGLGRINRLSRSAAMLWPAIDAAATRQTRRPLRVLDLACGGGDVLIQLAKRAAALGKPIEFAGADVSPVALEYAQRQAEASGVFGATKIHWHEVDVFTQPLPHGYDLTMNSLFMHHLNESQAIEVLAKMKAASDTVLVNDLRRGPVAHAVTVVGTRLLSRSPVVHVDGPRSVRAAWTPGELAALAQHAGLTGHSLRRRFPWRMLLEWRRPDATPNRGSAA